MNLQKFPSHYRALVIGATGAIGSALATALRSDPECAEVFELSRGSTPPLDFDTEESIALAASGLAQSAPFDLIINAAGILHADSFMPEKKLSDLNYAQLISTFRINTFGPALCFKYFSPLLSRGHCVMAMLSARVGSIEDNRLGGWYSYRASKAALNMLVKTASIEISRSRPQAIVISLHPGTVSSNLSRPFKGGENARPADQAALELLRVIKGLSPSDTGGFRSFSGEQIAW